MLRLILSLLLLALPAGIAQATAPAPDVYPTDRCVADKLSASASACRAIFEAEAFGEIIPGHVVVKRREAARNALVAAFSRAEAESQDAGVDCAQTTATADEVLTHLSDGAVGVAAHVRSAATGARFLKKIRAFGALRASGIGCFLYLQAEGHHLLYRQHDRERKRLAHAEALAGGWLELLLRWSALGKEGAAKVAAAVKALTDEAVLAHVVSPNVPQQFVMIDPPDQIDYKGKTLEPICSRGTPWVHFVKRGSVNKLLVYYQGGGACWDYLTCEAIKTFKQTTGPNENPQNATSGFANLNNPDNPFKDWHMVVVPYCTGDIHWGDATVVHPFQAVGQPPDPNGPKSTIHHRGFVNAQVAEKWAREHFVHPEEVFVTGSSAGSYGAVLNSLYLQEHVYPSSQFEVLGDAGNGIVPQAFIDTQISKWNIEKNLPAWIPDLNKPITELNTSDLLSASARFYPHNRFANYSAAFDGGSGGQVGFYRVMTQPDNPLLWASWWEASCPWNAGMKAQVAASYAGAPANYRYYIGSGSRHTMWGNNKVYTDTTGGVPTIVDWVQAMRAGSADWVNVETTDPGLLLPGDPKPNPAQPPYTATPPSTTADRIVCE